MHVELDFTGSGLSYISGDHVAVLPENSAQLVSRIGELLNVDLDVVFSLTNVDGVCVCVCVCVHVLCVCGVFVCVVCGLCSTNV